MKLPCICDKGWHSFSANEMVDIVGAFQRGELSKIRYRKGVVTGVFSMCLLYADTSDDERFTGICGAESPDGRVCKLPRRHREGRHGYSVERYPGKRSDKL